MDSKKLSANAKYIDIILIVNLAVEYFYHRIPFVTGFINVFAWIIYIVIWICIPIIFIVVYFVVFTDKFDNKLNSNNEELKQESKIKKALITIRRFILAVILITLCYLLDYSFFFVTNCFLLLVGFIFRLPIVKNTFSIKMIKSMLLNKE